MWNVIRIAGSVISAWPGGFRTMCIGIIAVFVIDTAVALDQSQLDKIREKFNVPAVGYAFIYNEQFESKVSGLRIVGQDNPVDVTDKFRLRSLTKPMVATLVQVYVDRGLLRWNTRLGEALPAFKAQMQEQFREVTIEMLTSHRSGLPEHFDMPEVLGSGIDGRVGRQLIARKLLSTKPRYRPDNFLFSQWNYVIVGAILESLTGQSFEQLMEEELFKPLRMESCGFGLATKNERDQSQPWDHEKVGKEFRAVRTDSAATLAPSGSIHCSMADYLKFARAHIDGFRGRDTAILPAASFRRLHEPAPFQHYTYGGWNRIKPGWAAASALHHLGSDLGNFAVVWILPEIRFAVIAVTNAGDHDYGSRVTDEVVRSVIQDLLP